MSDFEIETQRRLAAQIEENRELRDALQRGGAERDRLAAEVEKWQAATALAREAAALVGDDR